MPVKQVMLRRVEFPQPDGPIVATNSPFLSSKFTFFNFVVSISTVLNICESYIALVMPLADLIS